MAAVRRSAVSLSCCWDILRLWMQFWFGRERETLQSIPTSSKGDSKLVMEELARRHLIRPIATQGHIGDVLPDKIVYDAQTTSGGSGGPLFDDEGKVIGINFAMAREFGGSNFAIPVGYGTSLLNVKPQKP
jgi:hypothetical protein